MAQHKIYNRVDVMKSFLDDMMNDILEIDDVDADGNLPATNKKILDSLEKALASVHSQLSKVTNQAFKSANKLRRK